MTISPPEPRPSESAPAREGFRPRLRRGWGRFWRILTGGAHNPLQTSVAFGLGVVISLLVPPPFQTPAALGIALLLRLNGLVTLSGTLLCQPFTLPFILLLERRVGRWVLPPPAAPRPGGIWHPWVKPVLVGAPLTAAAAGILGAVLCYLLLVGWKAWRGRRSDDPGASA